MSKKSMAAFREQMQRVENAKQTRKENNEVFKMFISLSLYILQTEYGFGPKRAEAYVDHISDLIHKLNNEEITFDDVRKLINDKCKINIETII